MTAANEVRPQAGPPLSAAEILQNARELAARVREKDLAAEYDRLRRLPDDIVAEIRASGVMRIAMPKIWGGPEMTSMEQVEVIEALARSDASIAWCAFIWCDSGIYSGYLEDGVGREMYPSLDMATSGWVYPVAPAHRVEGGYRVSGQWMFGSGCNHCDWLVAGCVVLENGAPVLDADGRPLWRILMARPEDYEILDTWYTTGLRGTGSNDYRCQDLFVPEERSFSLLDPPKRPTQAAKCQDLLSFLVAQDVRHGGGRSQLPRRRQRPGRKPRWPVFRRPSMAGFGCPPRVQADGPRP